MTTTTANIAALLGLSSPAAALPGTPGAAPAGAQGGFEQLLALVLGDADAPGARTGADPMLLPDDVRGAGGDQDSRQGSDALVVPATQVATNPSGPPVDVMARNNVVDSPDPAPRDESGDGSLSGRVRTGFPQSGAAANRESIPPAAGAHVGASPQGTERAIPVEPGLAGRPVAAEQNADSRARDIAATPETSGARSPIASGDVLRRGVTDRAARQTPVVDADAGDTGAASATRNPGRIVDTVSHVAGTGAPETEFVSGRGVVRNTPAPVEAAARDQIMAARPVPNPTAAGQPDALVEAPFIAGEPIVRSRRMEASASRPSPGVPEIMQSETNGGLREVARVVPGARASEPNPRVTNEPSVRRRRPAVRGERPVLQGPPSQHVPDAVDPASGLPVGPAPTAAPPAEAIGPDRPNGSLPANSTVPYATPSTVGEAGQVHGNAVRVAHGRSDIAPAVRHEVRDFVRLRGGADGFHNAKIRIHPPELGGVSIHFDVRDRRVSMELVVDNRDVKAILDSHQSGIRAALNEHGLSLDSFNVGMSHHSDTNPGGQTGGGPASSDSADHSGATGDVAPPVWFRSAQVVTDKRVNVLA